MATTIISTQPQYTFGVMTTNVVAGLITANSLLERLKTAVATASAGTTDDGTQFEISVGSPGSTVPLNLFGVVSDPNNPGAKGKDYQYAVNQLDAMWAVFWNNAKPYLEQLDQGTVPR